MTEHKNQTSIENFEPNVVAAFSYLIPPLTGIVFYLLEKKSKFVRFHAFQSILFGIAIVGINFLLGALMIIPFGFLLDRLFSLLGFAFWLMLIWKAYQNEEFVLPYIGKIAQDNSGFDKPLGHKAAEETKQKEESETK